MRAVFAVFLLTNLLVANIAIVVKVDGDAHLIRDGVESKIAQNQNLNEADEIATKDASRVLIRFTESDVAVAIGANSAMRIVSENEADQQSGKSYFLVNQTIKKLATPTFAIRSKTATIGVRGTEFVVENDQKEAVYLASGAVEAKANSGKFAHYKSVVDQKKAFEKFKSDQMKAFEEYKADQELRFIAYKESISLKKNSQLVFDGERAVESELDKAAVDEIKEFRDFATK